MSLDTLAVVYRRPRPEVVTGFKVFRRYTRAVGSRTEAVLTFEYHHHFRLGRTTFGCQNRLPIYFQEFPHRRWLTAIPVRLFSFSRVSFSRVGNLNVANRHYQSGFHCFTSEAAAWQWCGNNRADYAVVPVQTRNVTARGTLDGNECLVAQQLRVL